jgi:predicted dehydrogenase
VEYIKIAPDELGIPNSIPLPDRKDWRIGMVGFGGIARGGHAPAYSHVGWSVVAIADPDPDARKVARDKFGIQRTYPDYHQLIEDEQVDVIDLLTQPTLRVDVIRSAAELGKPIITEKPFSTDIEECERMVEIAEEAGIKLAVHQNYRWMKMNYLAHHIIKRGLIGEPFFASIEIFGTQDVVLADHDFYSRCENFLTVQWDNHLADLLRYWTSRDANRVLAYTSRMTGQNFMSDNLLMVVADFGTGLTGHILHSELLRSSLGGVQCRVDGDKGSITFNFNDTLLLESKNLDKGIYSLDTSGSKFVSSFAGSMGDFLIAIEKGTEPMVSGRRNLPTIRTILAEDESARSGGKWIVINQ